MKDKIMATVVVLLIVIFTCLMVYAIWEESNSPMQLNKSEWECVRTETRITNVIVGGKLMPQSKQECVEYKHN